MHVLPRADSYDLPVMKFTSFLFFFNLWEKGHVMLFHLGATWLPPTTGQVSMGYIPMELAEALGGSRM